MRHLLIAVPYCFPIAALIAVVFLPRLIPDEVYCNLARIGCLILGALGFGLLSRLLVDAGLLGEEPVECEDEQRASDGD